MILTKEETVTLKSAIDLLDAVQDIFCAESCIICPLFDRFTEACSMAPAISRLALINSSYGQEDAE